MTVDLSALPDNDLIDELLWRVPNGFVQSVESELRLRLSSLRQERDRATSDASHAWGPVVHAAERRAVQAERERDEWKHRHGETLASARIAIDRADKAERERDDCLACVADDAGRALRAEARVRELEAKEPGWSLATHSHLAQLAADWGVQSQRANDRVAVLETALREALGQIGDDEVRRSIADAAGIDLASLIALTSTVQSEEGK